MIVMAWSRVWLYGVKGRMVFSSMVADVNIIFQSHVNSVSRMLVPQNIFQEGWMGGVGLWILWKGKLLMDNMKHACFNAMERMKAAERLSLSFVFRDMTKTNPPSGRELFVALSIYYITTYES